MELHRAAVADSGQLPRHSGCQCPGCGKDGETVFSIRQTSLAFKSTIPTSVGEIKTEESFDLFGVGGGNTQIRLLNAWGELGDLAWGSTTRCS